MDPRRHRVRPKPRDYSYVLNKKVKRLALKSALYAKAASGDIVVVDSLNLDEVKTKAMKGFLDTVGPRRPSSSPRGERDRHQVRPEHPLRGHHHRQDPERLRHRERRKVYR